MLKFRVVFYDEDFVLEEIEVLAKDEVEAERVAISKLSRDLVTIYTQVVAYYEEEEW